MILVCVGISGSDAGGMRWCVLGISDGVYRPVFGLKYVWVRILICLCECSVRNLRVSSGCLGPEFDARICGL